MSTVAHSYYEVGNDVLAKPNALCDVVESLGGKSVAIFCNTPSDADFVEVILGRRGIPSRKLVGHIPQRAAAQMAQEVISGEAQVLILTDISARFIEVENFDCVMNHSLHSDPEVYIHRMGTPSDESKISLVVSIIGPTDLSNFHYLKKLLDFEFEKKELPSEADRFLQQFEKIQAEASSTKEKNAKFVDLAKKILADAGSEDVVALLLQKALEALPAAKSTAGKGSSRREDRGSRDEQRGGRGDRRGRGEEAYDGASEDRYGDSRHGEGRYGDRDDDRGDRPQRNMLPPKKELRIYIGRGSEAGMTDTALRDLMAKSAGADSSIPVERTVVRGKYSFIDVSETQGEAALQALEQGSFADGGKVLALKAAVLSIPQEAPAQSEEAGSAGDDGAVLEDSGDAQEIAVHDE